MKVMLVSFPSNAHDGLLLKEETPPLALYVLAASLRVQSHEVIIIDPNIFHDISLSSAMDKFICIVEDNINNLHLIGFSANTFNWAIAKIAINRVKEKYKNLTVVLGGLHASIFDKYILSTTPVDYIIRGEGEVLLNRLLNAIHNDKEPIESICGLSYYKDEHITSNPDNLLLSSEELNKLPLPAYDLIPRNSYDHISAETSRGCRYSCAFCSIPYRYAWRSFSKQDIIARIKYAKRYIHYVNVKNIINISDDCFTEDSDRAYEILKYLYEEKDGITYFIEARISNLLKNNLVEKIKPDYIFRMQVGIECGYDEGLRKIRKGLSINQIHECFSRMKLTGLNSKAFVSFIIGFPWETKEDIIKTITTMQQIVVKYNVFCNLNWLLFLPSDLWNNRKYYNIFVNESLYDDFLWHAYLDYFLDCHPLITYSDFKDINRLLFQIQTKNPLFNFNMPIFLHNEHQKSQIRE